VPRYRCATDLPACSTVASGAACCTVSSNIGWRACLIILGGICIIVFFLRALVFNFLESPKFLLGRGKEAEAIEVLHKIARFNRAPPPTLTVDDFAEIDQTMSQTSDPTSTAPLNTRTTAKKVVRESVQRIKHLKGLFETKLAAFTFAVLAIAYMGDFWSFNLAGEWWCVDCRIIKGDHPCQSFPLLTATGSFLPIILARNNVSSGTQTVNDTYRQYIYIYLPGILGCIMAMGAVNLPIVGRKASCPARAHLDWRMSADRRTCSSCSGRSSLVRHCKDCPWRCIPRSGRRLVTSVSTRGSTSCRA
jgi:MFS family permease